MSISMVKQCLCIIINTFTFFVKILGCNICQKGLIKFDPRPVSLGTLINEIIDSHKQMAINKSISVISKIRNGLFIYADEYMLSTILRNLISNAIKFTTVHGEITISSKYFMVKEQPGEKILEISVTDSGIGIEKNVISKLFRIDTSFSTKGTQKEAGTGLGLILCKEFVEKHSGKIWVESEVGKGSTFKFTLP